MTIVIGVILATCAILLMIAIQSSRMRGVVASEARRARARRREAKRGQGERSGRSRARKAPAAALLGATPEPEEPAKFSAVRRYAISVARSDDGEPYLTFSCVACGATALVLRGERPPRPTAVMCCGQLLGTVGSLERAGQPYLRDKGGKRNFASLGSPVRPPAAVARAGKSQNPG